jgi:hypothetical protein
MNTRAALPKVSPRGHALPARAWAGALAVALTVWAAVGAVPAWADGERLELEGAWRVERRNDDGATVAVLPAQEALLFVGRPVQPELVVACLAGRTDLWIDFGRPIHPADAPLRINLRLDRGRPSQATWTIGPERRRAHMVEDRLDAALRRAGTGASERASLGATELAQHLADHDRLAIRAATAYGGHVAVSFDLAGMNDALAHLADTCSWSESVKATLRFP